MGASSQNRGHLCIETRGSLRYCLRQCIFHIITHCVTWLGIISKAPDTLKRSKIHMRSRCRLYTYMLTCQLYTANCRKFATNCRLYTLTLWTIHNGVFGAPNVCNGAPIEEITCVTLYRPNTFTRCYFQAISVIGKLHGYVTFINLNFVLLSLSFVL